MKVLAIALNTFKEAVRNRVLYVLLFFAVAILLGSWVASTLAIFGQDRVIRNFGVGAINLISVLIAVFVGVGMVYNDMDKKTIYTIISKPIHRWHFLLGKYLGLYLTVLVNIIFMTFIFLIVLYYRSYIEGGEMERALLLQDDGTWRDAPAFGAPALYLIVSFIKSMAQAFLTIVTLGAYHSPVTSGIMAVTFLTMLELALVTAFAILFSSFSSPTLSAFLTVTAFLIGRLNQDIYAYAYTIVQQAKGLGNLAGGQLITYYFAVAASHIAPNLSFFDQREVFSDGLVPEIDPYYVLYGLAYTAAILVIAGLIFRRRNFK